MRRIQYYYIVLLCFIFSVGFYCTTGDVAGTGHEGEAIVLGVVRDSAGTGMKHILVELLPADFNPVTQIEKQRGAQSEETRFNPLEDNKLWAYTNDSGRFEIDAVPAGAYTLIGIDYLTAKVIYHPSITVAKQNVNTGYDTAKTKGQILVTITDTLSIPSSYLYIPGTYYYNKVDSSGVNGIQAPAGIVRVNSYNTSNQRTDTLIDNAVINSGGIVDSSNSVSLPSMFCVGDTGTVATDLNFKVYGSKCNNGHRVDYRLDWGDTTVSPWFEDSSAAIAYSHSWNKKGIYWVHAQARCRVETYLTSRWSSPTIVTIMDTIIDTITVKTPRMPYGRDSILAGTFESFMTGGSHVWPDTSVEYRFDWGDTLISSWSIDTMREHSWFYQGVYQVRAQARKKSNPSVVSAWSAPLWVTVFDTSQYYVIQPGYVEGPGTIKAKSKAIFKTGGSRCSIGGMIQYRFNWGDSTLSQWIIGDTSTINDTNGMSFTITAADTHFYAVKGYYDIRSQARSMKDTAVVSAWTTSFRLYVLDTLDTVAVDTPHVPLGPDSLFLGDTGSFVTGPGKFEGRNSYIQYLFTWGDTMPSAWSIDTIQKHSWQNVGTYQIRARARRISNTGSLLDTSIASAWSQPHYVKILERVPTPWKPRGQDTIQAGLMYSYSTGGSYNTHYRFDWGDSTTSSWSVDTLKQHAWSNTGVFMVRAQARKIADTLKVSSWSAPLLVRTATDTTTIKTPRVPYGLDSITSGVSYSYMTGGSYIWPYYPVHYRFDWGDSTYSSWSVDTTQEHSWSSAGVFGVRAQARKISDTLNISSWSNPFNVMVTSYGRQSEAIKPERVPNIDYNVNNTSKQR